eukprot:1612234-Prymnesium_polylepis.1
MVVGVPSEHVAVAGRSVAPEAHCAVSTPSPRHTKPDSNVAACVAETGDTYPSSRMLSYKPVVWLTLITRSKAEPSLTPTFFHRADPPGKAPPDASVAPFGIIHCPV